MNISESGCIGLIKFVLVHFKYEPKATTSMISKLYIEPVNRNNLIAHSMPQHSMIMYYIGLVFPLLVSTSGLPFFSTSGNHLGKIVLIVYVIKPLCISGFFMFHSFCIGRPIQLYQYISFECITSID